jgi:hypothetical protein
MSDMALAAKAAGQTGVRIPIDVTTLVEQVRLMPRAGASLKQDVADTLKRAGLDKPILASALDKQPP